MAPGRLPHERPHLDHRCRIDLTLDEAEVRDALRTEVAQLLREVLRSLGRKHALAIADVGGLQLG